MPILSNFPSGVGNVDDAVKIENLTYEEYTALETKDPNTMYLVKDVTMFDFPVDENPTSGSPNAVSSGGVYTALEGKAPTTHASQHAADGSDPVTPEAIGAFPVINAGGSANDMDNIIMSGNHYGVYTVNSATGGTPYKYGKSDYAHGIIFSSGFAGSKNSYGEQIAFIDGAQYPFHRYMRNGTISDWTGLFGEGHLPSAAEVGAFSLSDINSGIPSDADLNSYTTPGTYRCSGATVASTLLNCPTTQAFMLHVIHITGTSGNDRIMQEIRSNVDTAPLYRRSLVSAGWGNWGRVYTTNNPPTASEIGAGTFGGKVVANSSGQTYSAYLLRNTRLASSDTNPTVDGQICWTYG